MTDLDTLPDAAQALERMRAAPPLVHCITNYVAMNFAANVLLAAGAAPAMIHAPDEAGDFAAIAGALTVNIGTLDALWVEGMKAAIAGANGAGKPWVFDPVAHFATPWRARMAQELLAMGPAVTRGNASEIMALAGVESAGRGVDAGDSVVAAEDAARRLAQQTGGVVAVTGEVDFVTDGTRAARITGGHALMPQVTATGCALTTLVGAYVATAPDAFTGTCAALAHFAAAGEAAGKGAAGPGSFAVRFLDALAATGAGDISGRIAGA
jgi:hydroxyethylthiazole kinase